MTSRKCGIEKQETEKSLRLHNFHTIPVDLFFLTVYLQDMVFLVVKC